MLSNSKLRHVAVLAEHRNFRVAAEKLHLTQPALSRSIQSIERALGVRLFDRGRGGVELTAFGRTVVGHAREILLAIDGLHREVDLMKGLGTGTLKVCLGPYPLALSGQRAVARLLADYPDIHCRVRVAKFADIAEAVLKGRCEMGIADLAGASERGLVAESLVRRQGYFFVRPEHPLAGRRRRALADVLAYPWAAVRVPARISSRLPRDVGRAGHWDRETNEFVPALEVDVVADFLGLARDSDILVAATLTMAETDLSEGRLVVVPFREPWFRLDYGFLTRPNRTLSPSTQKFKEIVREIEADLDEREAALRKEYL
jgi:DNA-binding transcriptional LysR family regulator